MGELVQLPLDKIKVKEIEASKICPSCKTEYPLTETYWYRARPREGHKKEGWQSNCRVCWKEINRKNKLRRKGKL